MYLPKNSVQYVKYFYIFLRVRIPTHRGDLSSTVEVTRTGFLSIQ